MRSYSLIFVLTICATVSMIMCDGQVPVQVPAASTPTPTDFFKEKIDGDLSKITWAHEVNNVAKLGVELKKENVMMLEADVRMGKVNNTGDDKPIMSHTLPTSDLSLANFLDTVVKYNAAKENKVKKGIKLDFKTMDAFTKSEGILKQYSPILFPVILNADILSGPGSPEIPEVSATQFILGAKTFPNYVLSVGWTTKMTNDSAKNKYEQKQINDMLTEIKKDVKQMVTYPVRAGMVENTDFKLWVDLLENTKNTTGKSATLTIWSSDPKDQIDTAKLKKLVDTIGKEKVYLDVPDKIREAMSSAADHLPGIFVVLAMIAANFFYTTL